MKVMTAAGMAAEASKENKVIRDRLEQVAADLFFVEMMTDTLIEDDGGEGGSEDA